LDSYLGVRGYVAKMSAELTEIDGLSELVKGLLVDVRCLVHQQIALAKADVRAEVAKVRDTARMFALGLVALLLGSILVPFLLVDLLLYGTNYRLPEWGADAIVASLFLSIGMITLRRAIKSSSARYRAAFDVAKG